jgi:hypothetical protein
MQTESRDRQVVERRPRSRSGFLLPPADRQPPSRRPQAPGGLTPSWKTQSRPPHNVLNAGVTMAGLRAMSGFLTALVILALRQQEAPLAWYGAVALAAVAANLCGAVMAQRATLFARLEALFNPAGYWERSSPPWWSCRSCPDSYLSPRWFCSVEPCPSLACQELAAIGDQTRRTNPRRPTAHT